MPRLSSKVFKGQCSRIATFNLIKRRMVIVRSSSCRNIRRCDCNAILNSVQVTGDLDNTGGTVHVCLQVGLVTDGIEVRVGHGFLGRQAFLLYCQHDAIMMPSDLGCGSVPGGHNARACRENQ